MISAGPALAADTIITQTDDYPAFSRRFCTADHKLAQIFIVPVTVFANYREITCENGQSMLRMSEPMDDPGRYGSPGPRENLIGFIEAATERTLRPCRVAILRAADATLADGVDGPDGIAMCQNEVVNNLKQGSRP